MLRFGTLKIYSIKRGIPLTDIPLSGFDCIYILNRHKKFCNGFITCDNINLINRPLKLALSNINIFFKKHKKNVAMISLVATI